MPPSAAIPRSRLADPSLAELAARLGPGVRLSDDPADFERHAGDFTLERPSRVRPLAVAYPAGTAEVSAILAACTALGLPVVPQGGLTGVAGGAVPSEGCLVLSLERLRGIEELDEAAGTMTVLAGTPLQTVQEAAEAVGLTFPLDLGARGSCTIGGNIATNAGGNRVLRYGMMRDLVLGLEVVLADGRVLSSLNKMVKNNAGYDLKQLFVGSEGTLGVVTRGVLRLFPKPTTANTVLCAVASLSEVLALLRHARQALGPQLSAFEVMWRDYYHVATGLVGRAPLAPEAGEAFVLIDSLGNDPQADEAGFARFLEQAVEQELILDAVVAQSLTDAARFWSVREAIADLPGLWGRCVNFDVSVPIGDVPVFVEDCRRALKAALPDTKMVAFGHLADSNIHVTCDDPEGRLKHEIETIVFDAVKRWNGSISAEHGIGLEKKAFLHLSRTPVELELMQALKRALDPNAILNPGKVIDA